MMYALITKIFAQDVPALLPDSIPSKKQELEMLKTLPFDEFIDKVVNSMITFAINLTIAIVVFYAGKFIIGKIHNVFTSIFVKRKVDASLATFILSLVRMLLYFILIVTVIGILGIETSSFIAIFASAGVALGMALSGTLQNFAGGVLILLLKPYKVGDYIEASGFAGFVKEIQIFNTIIVTFDNKSIIIPNGGLSTSSINNYSTEAYRRVDWDISISYGDSVELARNAILDIISQDDRIVQADSDPLDSIAVEDEAPDDSISFDIDKPKQNLFDRVFHKKRKVTDEQTDALKPKAKSASHALVSKPQPAPAVYVKQLADSSVVLSVRAWTRNEYYWSVFFELNEKFYTLLPERGVRFPFPQLDVHIDK